MDAKNEKRIKEMLDILFNSGPDDGKYLLVIEKEVSLIIEKIEMDNKTLKTENWTDYTAPECLLCDCEFKLWESASTLHTQKGELLICNRCAHDIQRTLEKGKKLNERRNENE